MVAVAGKRARAGNAIGGLAPTRSSSRGSPRAWGVIVCRPGRLFKAMGLGWYLGSFYFNFQNAELFRQQAQQG